MISSFQFDFFTPCYTFLKFDIFSFNEQAFKSAIQGQNAQIWSERANRWLKELSIFQQSYAFGDQTSDNLLQVDQLSNNELPIWLAAQRAVTRYEGLLSPVGPRGRLLKKLLMWAGLIPSIAKETFDLESDVTASEPYLRSVSLPLPHCCSFSQIY